MIDRYFSLCVQNKTDVYCIPYPIILGHCYEANIDWLCLEEIPDRRYSLGRDCQDREVANGSAGQDRGF